MFGIAAVAKEFAPLFWGEEFSVCAPMMVGLSISLPLWTIGESIRNQFLLPNGRDHEYMNSFLVGVAVNAVFNFILIPTYGAMGAICATIAAEFAMNAVQIYFVRKELNIIHDLLQTFPYFIIGLIMCFSVRCLADALNSNLLVKVLMEIIIGGSIYGVLSVSYEALTHRFLLLDVLQRHKI